MNKHIFITGAKGFLGRYCAKHFSEQGWCVIGLGHDSSPKIEHEHWGMHAWYKTDITLESLLQIATKHHIPRAIIHCAGGGSVGFSYTHPQEDFLRTVATTVDVLNFARMHSPDIAVLYPSSAAVYGATSRQPILETTPLNPVSPYGKHKVMAEQMCQIYATEWSIPTTIIRFFSLYGPELNKQLFWDACQKARLGKFDFEGSGQESRDLLYIKDATKLIKIMLTQATPACPIVNGGTGLGVSIREILQFVGANLSPPQQPVFSGQIREGDPTHLIADITKAQEFGFISSYFWQKGIKDYIQWFFHKGTE